MCWLSRNVALPESSSDFRFPIKAAKSSFEHSVFPEEGKIEQKYHVRSQWAAVKGSNLTHSPR